MTKYAPLSEFLNHQPVDVVRLEFSDVEKILHAPLPASAYEHQAWWANNPDGHSHCRAWHSAGWKTENLNIAGRTVTFRRVRGNIPSTAFDPSSPASALDPWGALAGTVKIVDEGALETPIGAVWEAEANGR